MSHRVSMTGLNESVLVLRVWTDTNHQVPLRATVTSTSWLLGVAPTDGDLATVAVGTTIDEILDHLRAWLERYIESAT